MFVPLPESACFDRTAGATASYSCPFRNTTVTLCQQQEKVLFLCSEGHLKRALLAASVPKLPFDDSEKFGKMPGACSSPTSGPSLADRAFRCHDDPSQIINYQLDMQQACIMDSIHFHPCASSESAAEALAELLNYEFPLATD